MVNIADIRKPLFAILAIVALGFAWWVSRDYLSIEFLVRQETALRQFGEQRPVMSMLLGYLIYVAVTGLSVPGAALLTLVFGWYFGFWRCLLIVSFGSTTGATLSFLLSRLLLQDWVRSRLGHRVNQIAERFDIDGAYYLFTLRLIPAVPFFVINLVMGLTRIRVWTFWWVSQVGMLPGTIAYVYAGSVLPSLEAITAGGVATVLTWQLLVALAMIGLLPLAIKTILARFAKTNNESNDEQTSGT